MHTHEPQEPNPAAPRTRTDRGALLAAIASISVMGLATGLTLPLVSLRLFEAGAPAGLIAVFAALPAVGTILTSLALDPLTQRFGPRRLLVLAVLTSLASILVLATPFRAWPWALSRIAMGVSASILFALGEARILEVSSAAARGRWAGAYATTLTACQFAGPALLALLGTRAAAPLAVAVLLHLASCILLLRTRWQHAPHAGEGPLAPRAFFGGCLPLAAAVLFFSMFDSTALALLPLYGLKIGFGTQAATLMASAVFLGDACLQVPLGWAADRFGRPGVHLACALATALVALAVPLALPVPLGVWSCLFLMGGAAGALYTLAIVRLGDRFRGRQLIAANAYVGMLWGAGSLAGPLAGSAAMELWRPHGLMFFVGIGALMCAALMLVRAAPRAVTAR